MRLSAAYQGRAPVLQNAELDIAPGEILALAGRSGEGKSTIAMAVLKLLRDGKASGEVSFQGRELLSLSEREMRRIRGREIALVPQSPIAALNPALTLGAQFREAWSAHSSAPYTECEPRIRELFSNVSLPPEPQFLRRYPAELSVVDLAQRVLIAMALLHRPALILADEPTSALDVITQAEILDLLARLNRELKTAILYISHDLLSVASLCHRVAILHQGGLSNVDPFPRSSAAPSIPTRNDSSHRSRRNPSSGLLQFD
jgi:ABC-type glutathione transport system ATPase component